eukprot:gene5360-7111_t
MAWREHASQMKRSEENNNNNNENSLKKSGRSSEYVTNLVKVRIRVRLYSTGLDSTVVAVAAKSGVQRFVVDHMQEAVYDSRLLAVRTRAWLVKMGLFRICGVEVDGMAEVVVECGILLVVDCSLLIEVIGCREADVLSLDEVVSRVERSLAEFIVV